MSDEFTLLISIVGSFVSIFGLDLLTGGRFAYRLFGRFRETRLRREINRPNRMNARKIVGREDDLARLRKTLTSSGRGALVPVATVTGGAGVGKSALARHYIATYRDEYARAEIIRSETEDSLTRDLAGLADLIEKPEKTIPLKRRAQEALELITQRTEHDPWLLVFDNVETPEAIAPWMPDGRKLHLLITTRWPDWKGEGFEALPTGQLSPDAAVKLLRQEAEREDPDFPKLAGELGHLPLPLVQAGEWLAANQRSTAKDYLTRLDKMLLLEPGTSGDYDNSTGAAIRLTLDSLSADAKAIVGILAWFDPDDISAAPFELLGRRPWLARFRSRFVRLVPRRVWAICRDVGRLDATFTELRLKALVEDRSEEPGQYRMHRVSQLVARTALKRTAVPKSAVALLAAVYPGGAFSSGNWPVCRTLTPHVRALWGSEQAPKGAAMEFLLNQASIFLDKMADFDGAVAMARAALELKQARRPESDREIAVGHATLGSALRRLGDLDAAEAALRQAVTLEAKHRPDSIDLAESRDLLGGLLLDRGRAGVAGAFEAAMQEYERAEAIIREQAGSNSDALARVINNMGALRSAMGQKEAAWEHYEQALAIRLEVLPDGDARLGYGYNNTGAMALEAGQTEVAEARLRRALAIRQAAHVETPRHPDILITVGWLVSTLLVLGRRDPAKRAEALALCADYDLDPTEWEQITRKLPDPLDPTA